MDIFKTMEGTECKQVLFFEEKDVSLKAIIVLHNSTLGPALAKCKMYNYKTEDEALRDAIDSASYNTYISALLKKGMGGGSVVLIGDPSKDKSEIYFRALGNILNKLQGKIYLTNGSGTDLTDMSYVRKESKYVLGISQKLNSSGDTSLSLAKGMILGMKAIVKERFEKSSLTDLSIVVQGVGNVGNKLVQELLKEKVSITITDLNYDKIKSIQDVNPQIKVVQPDKIYSQKCDIFVSCAYDGIITKENVEHLNTKILTGSISKFSYEKEALETLNSKGILVVPGYIINGGEMIQLSDEYEGYGSSRTDEDFSEIYHSTLSLLQKSTQSGNSTLIDDSLQIAKKYLSEISLINALK